MKMKSCHTPALIVAMLAVTAATLSARTWTEATSGRTLEGEFTGMNGDNVVIKRADGGTVKVPLSRLSEADRTFARLQTAKPADGEGGGGSLGKLKPPVTLKALPITGKGEERKSGLEVTNTGTRAIKNMSVNVYFLGADGSIVKGGRGVPHSESFFTLPKENLGRGKTYTTEVTSFFMTDDTTAIDGIVAELTFNDGSSWPAFPAKPPARKGDDPVSAVMLGVIGSGGMSAAAVACFNHDSKAVISVDYRIHYLDGDGQLLETAGYGYSSDSPIMEPGKGIVITGGDPPPEGTTDVRVNVIKVGFADKGGWTPKEEATSPEGDEPPSDNETLKLVMVTTDGYSKPTPVDKLKKEAGYFRKWKDRSDVIQVHPFDPKRPARIDFSKITTKQKGTIILNLHRHPSGDCAAALLVDGEVKEEVEVTGDKWITVSADFDHQKVVLEGRVGGANKWYYEHLFTSYAIAK